MADNRDECEEYSDHDASLRVAVLDASPSIRMPRSPAGPGGCGDGGIEHVVSLVQLLRGLGVTSYLEGDALADEKTVRLWWLCQIMTEEWITWYCRYQLRFVRANRSWRDMTPSGVGLIYDVVPSSVRARLGRRIVAGQPCPRCATGRMTVFAHPDVGALGVFCNAECRVGRRGEFRSPFGVEVSREPLGRAEDERAIWQEPQLPEKRGEQLLEQLATELWTAGGPST